MNDTNALALEDATKGTARNLLLLRTRFFKVSPRSKLKGLTGYRRPGTRPLRAVRAVSKAQEAVSQAVASQIAPPGASESKAVSDPGS